MAAFANFAACETRVKAKISGFGDNTWVNAHAGRRFDGTLCVRVQRKLPPLTNGGEWVEITDDATV